MKPSMKVEPGTSASGDGFRPHVVVRVPAGFDVTIIESVTGKTITVAFDDDIGNKMQLLDVNVARKKTEEVAKNIQVRAWGGPGGRCWSFLPQGNGGLTKIIIRSGGAIDAISFVGKKGNGHKSFSRNFGGNGGKPQEINLELPREYLTSIRGTSGNFNGFHVVKLLEFTTNHGRKHGPFGSTGGNVFSMNINNNSAIVGFHGRCGSLLDALGIFIRPL